MATSNRTIVDSTPPPAFRVFVSSTYTDMLPYREAIKSALNKADCVPYGMERFGAEAIPPLEVCFRELEASQIYVCAIGMRYGTIDKETGKSYTQLEFEKARELGKPTLVFLADENRMSFKISEVDIGEGAEKLIEFKKNIKESKEVTCAFFDSEMSLQETVYRSILSEIKRQGMQTTLVPTVDFVEGAKAYRNFVRRPDRYKGSLLTLRVRMDGLYGGWLLKEDLFHAYEMSPGDTLYLNDLWVLGIEKIDVNEEVWNIGAFAQGDAADWLERNEVTQGTIFEGRFLPEYKRVRGIAISGVHQSDDAMIARLILVEGIRVIKHGAKTRSGSIDESSILNHLLMNHKKSSL